MQTPEATQLDQLMYRISHDLSASARALVELPNWIMEDLNGANITLPEEVEENFNFLTVNSRRLDTMVRDLLEYSRIGRNQTQGEVSMSKMLSGIFDEKPLPMGFEFSMDFPQQPIRFAQPDFTRLCRALLTNAVKHHDKAEGYIGFKVSVHDGTATIEVTDDGPGIAEANREKVLEILSTLKPRDEVEGSGMGLAIAQRITQHYGGSLDIAANPGRRGTLVRATVTLPERKTE